MKSKKAIDGHPLILNRRHIALSFMQSIVLTFTFFPLCLGLFISPSSFINVSCVARVYSAAENISLISLQGSASGREKVQYVGMHRFHYASKRQFLLLLDYCDEISIDFQLHFNPLHYITHPQPPFT